MKQKEINNIYPVLLKLSQMSFPYKKAHAIYMLMKDMSVHYQFATDKQKEIIEALSNSGDITINDNGTIKFNSKEIYSDFCTKIEEIGVTDIEINVNPIVITEEDIGNQIISATDIATVEKIIKFE